jgi:hypothetical protein
MGWILATRNISNSIRLGDLQSAGMVGSLALIGGAIQVPPLRHLLESIIPEPGSGPTEQTMDEGWFRCELLG